MLAFGHICYQRSCGAERLAKLSSKLGRVCRSLWKLLEGSCATCGKYAHVGRQVNACFSNFAKPPLPFVIARPGTLKMLASVARFDLLAFDLNARSSSLLKLGYQATGADPGSMPLER